jgi:MFS family permease
LQVSDSRAAPAPPSAADDRTATPESMYQQQVWDSLPRNYAAHVAHGLGGQTGFRLLMAPTFIPAYLAELSALVLGPTLATAVPGVARALQSLGQSLSPVLGATLIEHRRRVLPIGFLIGGLMRSQVLLIALAGFFLAPEWALASTLLCLTLFGLFMGMQSVIFNVLMSKTIPVERRGLLTGIRNALAGITAAGAALLGGKLVADNLLGNGYAATFLVAFVFTSIGLLALTLVREPEPPEVLARSTLGSRLGELPALLRADREFTVYFSARALATMGRMAMPSYILFAQTRMEIGGTELGMLTFAFILAQSASNLILGPAADRFGFRAIFLASVGVWIASVLGLMASADFAALLLVYAGTGAGLGGFMMSSQNLVLEFGSREDLPMKIAVANSASEAMAAVGFAIGSGIATIWGFIGLFWVAIACQTISLFVVAVFVREPRHRA